MTADRTKFLHSLSRRDFIHSMGAMAGMGLSPRLTEENQAEEELLEGDVETNEEKKPDHPLADPGRRIGIGIIGCGERGTAHIEILDQLKKDGDNIAITAVCDVYRPRLNRAVERTQGIGYMNHEALIEDPDVDVVLIATPDRLHGYQLIDAIQAGKDVYCETPVTHWRQLDLLKQVFDTVKESKQVVQIGAQCMSYSGWIQAALMIKQGAIGKPLHVQTGYFLNEHPAEALSIDDEEAKPGPDLLWERFRSDAPQRPYSVERFFRWHQFWDYTGGPATDVFPQILTPAVVMLGVTYPETVTASGGRFRTGGNGEMPDTFHLMIDYPEGVSVTLLCTSANDYPIPTIIRGEKGTITFSEKYVVATPMEGVKLPKAIDPIYRWESMPNFWRNFLSRCRMRKAPWCPIDLGCYVQAALQMGVLAYRERKIVCYNREKNQIVL